MPLKASIKSIVEKKLEEYEGRLNHMYLDSKGKVTVGVGHLIANRSSVSTLIMYTVKNNLPSTMATLKQKQDEYNVIAKQKKDYKASWYKKHTTLVMKDMDINTQRTKHLHCFYKELAGMYSKAKGYNTDFDGFPDEVQSALFDMIFNLGQTKLSHQYTKFNNAIKKEKWDIAAVQCNRVGIQSTRNSYVKGLFTNAHNAKKTTKVTP